MSQGANETVAGLGDAGAAQAAIGDRGQEGLARQQKRHAMALLQVQTTENAVRVVRVIRG
jgi:hypothetical protein